MKKSIVAGIAAAVVIASGFAANVSANPRSGHSVAPSNPTVRSHHHHRFYPYAPYYYYSYGPGYVVDETPPPAPPPPKPVAEKPEADAKRGCDPQTYTVPSAAGGESQVTVLRC